MARRLLITASVLAHRAPATIGGSPWLTLLDQPGYTLANARITYTTADDRVSVSAFVNNLLDATYRNHALPAYAPAAGVLGDIVQYGDPRTFGGSLIYRF